MMDRILVEHEIKTVIHLAAQTIVGIANRSPISTFETNVQGTWNLLEAARRLASVEQLVIASTDKAYGTQDVLPYDEETPLQGSHPYDVSKSCADLIAQTYSRTYSLPLLITRCGNFYGGGDLNWNRIVPGTIRSVLREQAPVIRSDGLFIRDYFYVEDGANSYLHLVESLAKQPDLAGEAFNFSNEQPVTVIELVDLILELMGAQQLTPVILNQAINEIPKQFLSSQKAQRLLQWSPEFDLKTGLQRTIAWYRTYFEKHTEALND
jgi:CDP-glucose 4,6-dehydratase